jgi:hypothetical protein
MSLRHRLIPMIATMAAVCVGGQGVHPRPTPQDYPARKDTGGFILAAAVLTPDQVKKRFATNLNHGYIVVEVAVFLAKDHDTAIAAKDFMARFGANADLERPVSSQAIAARLGKKDTLPKTPDALDKVHVNTTETVVYEHGSGPGGRGTNGVYTGTSVGVGVGDPPYPPPSTQPSSARMDRAAIQAELDALSLPEGTLTEDAAGYLVFDKPSKGKNSPIKLTYYGPQGNIELTLQVK